MTRSRSATAELAALPLMSTRDLNRATLARQLLLERARIGVVSAIERVGAETFVYGARSHGTDAPAVGGKPGELPPGEIIVRLPGEAAPLVGSRIRVMAARDKLHLFSPDGRSRLEG